MSDSVSLPQNETQSVEAQGQKSSHPKWLAIQAKVQAEPHLMHSTAKAGKGHRHILNQHEDSKLSTLGQLMRSTAQSIQCLLRTRLGHAPSRVTCHLVSDKLIVWAEGSVTHTERCLAAWDSGQLQAMRSVVDGALRQQLIDVIQYHLNVEIITLLTDTCYEQECTGLIVLLANPPQVRKGKRG